jgi:DNA-binding CsgD family transcriptional regulator
VVSLQEFVGSDVLADSDFYRIIMQPQGWYDFLGADLREPGELDVRFRIGRYQGARAFSESEKHWVLQLLPHLERAIRLHTRINRSERERAVYEGAVQQLAVATFILDEHGALLSRNELASALLIAADVLRERDGRLEPVDRVDRAEFERLLQAALQGIRHSTATVQALQLHRAGGDLGMVLRALPAPQAAQGRGIPSVAVFVSDPQRAAEAPLEVITRLFGFTPTEANLAMLLANGLTLDEASDELGISRNTARTHLRAVFAKTGVTRQTGLVSLILKSVAPLA